MDGEMKLDQECFADVFVPLLLNQRPCFQLVRTCMNNE